MDLKAIKIILFLILLTSLQVMEAAGERTVLGKIAYLSGSARKTDKDETKWEGLKQDNRLHDGERIETGPQSRCEIDLRGKSIVRIDEHTRIKLKEDIDGNDKLSVEDGDIWLAHLLPDTGSAIEIETPGSACSIRGTVYRLSCDANHTTYRCYRGYITVKPAITSNKADRAETFSIGKGEELILVNDFKEYMNEQKKAFGAFTKEKMEDFKQYSQEQTLEFNESVKRDLKDFHKMNGYYVSVKTFDEKKDRASDWVRWNMERDKKRMSNLLPRKVKTFRLNP